ncbi:diguanylate cyclase [Desulfococcaceae bacterium HSG8]|nr:diguanylate cyclase [Desulfococcaceae bacterium HSG8]
MKKIRDDILKCLCDFADDDEKLIQQLELIIEKQGKQAYPIIFHILTHLDLESDNAEECWYEVVAHREIMGDALGRRVNLRTAICDYFCSINKSLKNPKVVELHVFESKANISKYDYLTGLYTRGSFEGFLVRELARSKRHDKETSVLFFDIDDFKAVNDTFGHLAGDVALKRIAEIVMNETRSEDIAARYGGEEIVIILPETGKAEALIVGERIREKVEQVRIEYLGHSVRLTISGGLASFSIDANEASNLVRCADDALYRAKSYGKNNIVLYSHDKRRYFRLDFNTEIRIRQIGFSDTSELTATCKNISVNGILFESDRLLDIGTKVELHVPINAGSEPFVIIGVVVRIELFDSDHYDIGVSFIEMDRTIKDEISRYLVKQLRRLAHS